ncbi:hypothetical protein Goarm_000515 [Gossypium armourianum]|uniref:Uncharacterized protein n=1 Tax=Gossypium armourianum TaxID=34283 RepID=A0A7J9KA54_9ROSI|nr:hypothetical protein [Gossypium armourianum]
MWDIVPVRGKEVQVTPQIICDFYNAPYYEKYFIDETDLEYFRDISMDNIINVLIEGRGKWKYRPELRAKKIKDWNKQRQESIATLASSQRFIRAQQELYTDMFGPTNLEQEEEVHEREEEGEDEKDDRSEEMDFEEGD